MFNIPILNTYIALVRDNRNYRNMWLSEVISQAGDWFNLIASASLIAGLSNSGIAIGGLFLARLVPLFVMTPVVGVVADRFNRRNIMIASDILRAIVVLGFLFVRTEQDIWLLYSLTVLQLSISAFYRPAWAALLPSLVPQKDLVTANALSGTTWSVMLAVGAALGGIATALFGITAAFLIDAATYLVAGWFVLQIQLPAKEADEPTATKPDGWREFVDGLRYLRHHPSALIFASVKGSAALAYGGMAVVEVNFAENVYPIGDDGSATLGLILFSVGIGTGLAPLIAQRITGDNQRAMKQAIWVTYLAMVVGYFMMSRAYTLPLLLLASIVRTAGSGTSWVYSSALLQMTVPDKYLGRVFSIDFAIFTLAASISTVWAGWAQDRWGMDPFQISLMLGIIPVIMTILWPIYLSFDLRKREAYSGL